MSATMFEVWSYLMASQTRADAVFAAGPFSTALEAEEAAAALNRSPLDGRFYFAVQLTNR